MLKRAATVLPSSATVAENRNASSGSRKSAARTAAWIGNASHAMAKSATRPAHCRSFMLSIFRRESDRESRQIDGHQDDSVTRLGRGAESTVAPGSDSLLHFILGHSVLRHRVAGRRILLHRVLRLMLLLGHFGHRILGHSILPHRVLRHRILGLHRIALHRILGHRILLHCVLCVRDRAGTHQTGRNQGSSKFVHLNLRKWTTGLHGKSAGFAAKAIYLPLPKLVA